MVFASTLPNSLTSSPGKTQENIWQRLDAEIVSSPKNNIAHLERKYQVPRSELFDLYTKYKSILSISEQLNITYNEPNKFSQDFLAASEKILIKLFEMVQKNSENFINWHEFLASMMILRCGNWSEKLDFFYKLYDEEGDSLVSMKEIQEIFMEKILNPSSSENETAIEIAKAFARAIYD